MTERVIPGGEPVTEAGRALLALNESEWSWATADPLEVSTMIAAIEREAYGRGYADAKAEDGPFDADDEATDD